MTAPLARVGDVIEHGQAIPGNVVRLRDADGAYWSNRLPDFRLPRLSDPDDALPDWWPLTVVEVDPEPQPAEPCMACPPHLRCICDPTDLFEPPNPTPRAVEGCPAHRARRAAQLFTEGVVESPLHPYGTPTFADLEQAEARANAELTAVVKLLDEAEVDSGSVSERVGYLVASDRRARSAHQELQARYDTVVSDRETIRGALELRKRRCRDEHGQPAESGPVVLSLPQVPDGAVALIGETGSRYVRAPLGNDRWRLEVAGNVPGLPLTEVFRVERSVTVEMAPPREPRTWPMLHESDTEPLPAQVQIIGGLNHAQIWRRCTSVSGRYEPIDGGPDRATLEELRYLGEVREVLT